MYDVRHPSMALEDESGRTFVIPGNIQDRRPSDKAAYRISSSLMERLEGVEREWLG